MMSLPFPTVEMGPRRGAHLRGLLRQPARGVGGGARRGGRRGSPGRRPPPRPPAPGAARLGQAAPRLSGAPAWLSPAEVPNRHSLNAELVHFVCRFLLTGMMRVRCIVNAHGHQYFVFAVSHPSSVILSKHLGDAGRCRVDVQHFSRYFGCIWPFLAALGYF